MLRNYAVNCASPRRKSASFRDSLWSLVEKLSGSIPRVKPKVGPGVVRKKISLVCRHPASASQQHQKACRPVSKPRGQGVLHVVGELCRCISAANNERKLCCSLSARGKDSRIRVAFGLVRAEGSRAGEQVRVTMWAAQYRRARELVPGYCVCPRPDARSHCTSLSVVVRALGAVRVLTSSAAYLGDRFDVECGATVRALCHVSSEVRSVICTNRRPSNSLWLD